MKERFADTSYFIALLSSTDENHRRAMALTSTTLGKLVTTTFVILELGNAFAGSHRRNEFVDFYRQLCQSRQVSIAEINEALFERGMVLYQSHSDKKWSLTDCISFVVMRDRAISEALTGDHHFEQAGFVALLKE